MQNAITRDHMASSHTYIQGTRRDSRFGSGGLPVAPAPRPATNCFAMVSFPFSSASSCLKYALPPKRIPALGIENTCRESNRKVRKGQKGERGGPLSYLPV